MNNTLALARLTLLAVAFLVVLVAWALRDLALLVGFSVMLAYALLPVVRAIERVRTPWGRSLPRGVVAASVMLAIVAVAAWLVVLALPRLAAEATRFASNPSQAPSRAESRSCSEASGSCSGSRCCRCWPSTCSPSRRRSA